MQLKSSLCNRSQTESETLNKLIKSQITNVSLEVKISGTLRLKREE